jgi:transposase
MGFFSTGKLEAYRFDHPHALRKYVKIDNGLQKGMESSHKMRISFLPESVKILQDELKKSYEVGNLRRVRRIAVLIMVAKRQTETDIIETWNISRQTIEAWIKAYFYRGLDSLSYKRPKGRPARLSKTQKQEIYQYIAAGPEACGYKTGCWTSVLIQDMIYKK